jgi:hypothetical protein
MNPHARLTPTGYRDPLGTPQRYPGGRTLTATAASQLRPRAPYAGSGCLPPSAGKQPTPARPLGGGYSCTQRGAKNAPYRQLPYGGYQGGCGDHQCADRP